jgi:hypothetical protein
MMSIVLALNGRRGGLGAGLADEHVDADPLDEHQDGDDHDRLDRGFLGGLTGGGRGRRGFTLGFRLLVGHSTSCATFGFL